MNYREALTQSMEAMANDPATCFIGYGVKYGGKAMGTLKNIPDQQLIETPVAENLMVGVAIGMALKGRKPVVFIERFDFILNAADAIVNHLDKIRGISRGEFAPNIILRVVAGNRTKPLFTGETHVQDLSAAFQSMVAFPVRQCRSAADVIANYHSAFAALGEHSSMLIEYKDLI
jgi:pyruvate dehydrogenase E1 component beta subunit